MKHILVLFFITSFFISNIVSQNNTLPAEPEFEAAVNKYTRSLNGKPGKNYWQNEVDYQIIADFNPETGKLEGWEHIKYKNNSPDVLDTLVINLYHNLYVKENVRYREVNSNDFNNGVLIKSIKIEKTAVKIDESKSTLYFLALNEPLKSKDEINLEIEWEFSMPQFTKIRVGKYGQNTWAVGYWYPQIAVYDDIYGWDKIPYNGLHEFYSPYASFDVKIRMPSDQIVWATGIWQNPKAILNAEYLNRYNNAFDSEKVVRIITKEDLSKKITKSDSTCVWHFKAENVSDFIFTTSNRYLWDGLSLITDKKNKRKTLVQTAYDPESKDFYDVAEISKKSLVYLSDTMPGISYPYPRMTVFNGDGGMEFPMLINDGSMSSLGATLTVTSHEIAHTYFPFYVGINQERFSWMDEGWAQFLPALFQENEVQGNDKAAESAWYYGMFAAGLNMPLMKFSYLVKGNSYWITSYYRPELAYRTLQNLLGEKIFLKALQEYINRWSGKHPCPYDFFYTFNDVANDDLGWFWKPWFFETAIPNLGIDSVAAVDKGYEIIIENKGGLPLPVHLTINYTDSTSEVVEGKVEMWKKGDKKLIFRQTTGKKIKEVMLGNDRIPDASSADNKKVLE